MNIYNNLPYDIQFKIDGMLLKEHNDKNTSRVIAEINDRQTILNIYDELCNNMIHLKTDCKFEWVFKKVMTWAVYGGKTITRRGEDYKSKYKRIFPKRHSSINKNIKGLYDFVYRNTTWFEYDSRMDFINSVRVAITWYLKSQYKTIESIYRLLVDFNLNNGIVYFEDDDIQGVIHQVADNLYNNFRFVFDRIHYSYSNFFNDDDDDDDDY
jgi:hypothetical protein